VGSFSGGRAVRIVRGSRREPTAHGPRPAVGRTATGYPDGSKPTARQLFSCPSPRHMPELVTIEKGAMPRPIACPAHLRGRRPAEGAT